MLGPRVFDPAIIFPHMIECDCRDFFPCLALKNMEAESVPINSLLKWESVVSALTGPNRKIKTEGDAG